MIIEAALAIQCILGEAENQGQDGIDALAHALNNRGRISGVYGCNRENHASPEVREMARNAWMTVNTTPDPTHGAKYWGTKSDLRKFERQRWFRSARDFIKIKDHTFFKLREKE